MTKADLIDHIQLHLGENIKTKHIFEKTTIGHVLDALGVVAGAALAEGGKVPLPGLGSLETVERKARKGRNPKTGAVIDIAASVGVAFRPGKALKDVVNGQS